MEPATSVLGPQPVFYSCLGLVYAQFANIDSIAEEMQVNKPQSRSAQNTLPWCACWLSRPEQNKCKRHAGRYAPYTLFADVDRYPHIRLHAHTQDIELYSGLRTPHAQVTTAFMMHHEYTRCTWVLMMHHEYI